MSRPTVWMPRGSDPSRKRSGTESSMRYTAGTCGASCRIRWTASCENDITRTQWSSGLRGVSRSNSASTRASWRSTRPAYRVGCLVSMASPTGRSVSITVASR